VIVGLHPSRGEVLNFSETDEVTMSQLICPWRACVLGRGIPVSREALYEEVWSDPATIVAPRYGLSDVGLLKICKKLHIPVPGRGYWARITAGRPARKPP
jgi:hypothetical protein